MATADKLKAIPLQHGGLQLSKITKKNNHSVGNVVFLHPHICGIFLGNMHLHGLIKFSKYNQLHTWYLLSILLMCGGFAILSMGYLRNKVYGMNPHTLEELKVSIGLEIDCVSEI